MSNPPAPASAPTAPARKSKFAAIMPRVRWYAAGLAHDFWKDGPETLFGSKPAAKPAKAPVRPRSPRDAASAAASPSVPAAPVKPEWRAAPGAIAEKMWGDGCVMPCDAALFDALVKPLGLAKDKTALDLSAGLGARLHKIIETVGCPVIGLERDPEIAARGMEMSIKKGLDKQASIALYDADDFSVARNYDGLIAREAFYNVKDKGVFFAALAKYANAKAQISFTDYILNPEDRQKPAVTAWQAHEKNAAPLSLVEMAEAWAKNGFTLTMHEDQTGLYRQDVLLGLKRLAAFLSGVRPDAETKKALALCMQDWVHRLAAMEQGLKFYQFRGIKA